MKNTLAENMLRFAPKNLKASNIKTLKQLAEQQSVAAPDFISLQHVAGFGTGGALKDSGTAKFLTAPFNNNNYWYWMPNDGKSVAQPINGMRLVATPDLIIKSGPERGERGPGPKAETKKAGIFMTDLVYTGPAQSADLDKPAGMQTGNWFPVYRDVINTLYSIGDCLKASGITRLTNSDVIAAAANLIIRMNGAGTTIFTDYTQQLPELTKAIKKKESDPTKLMLYRS